MIQKSDVCGAMMHKKYIFSNAFYGIAGQALTMVLGIVIPRLVLTNLGSEINGLLNSVNSAISYLALLEAGVGVTTLQALYRPVAQKNTAQINAVMAATNYFYKRTGTFYLIGIGLISFVYAFAVNSAIHRWIVLLVSLLSGLPGAIGYFLQGKYRILLQVEGKSYLLTNLTTFSTVAISVAKIILLNAGYGIVALQGMYFAVNMLQVALITFYVRRTYHWIDLSVKPDFSAMKQKRQALIHQISALIFSSTDMLVLTALCDLKTVSVYAMYNMLITLVKNALSTLSSSMSFAMGQAFSTDRERYLKMHSAYEVCNIMITFAVFTVVNLFLCPFLRLYTRGVTDVSYVDRWLPVLFTLVNFLDCGRRSSLQVISFAGHFQQTMGRSLLESGINLTVSVALAPFFGIYGVLLGTAAALLYRTNDMIFYSAKKILQIPVWPTYRRWAVNFLAYAAVMLAAARFEMNFSGYPGLILTAGVVFAAVLTLYLALNVVMDRESFYYLYQVFLSNHVKKLRSRIHV